VSGIWRKVRSAWSVSTLCTLFAVAACDTFPLTTTDFEQDLAQSPQVQRSKSEAWVAPPDIQLVLERSFGPVSEQRILLPNRTAVRGDNFLLLRAREGTLATIGRFEPLELLGATGDTPDPFEDFDSLLLETRDEPMGTLSWAVWTNNANLNCVLAFRRLDASSRVVPEGAGVMDMMLRNCVHGTVEQALAPALEVNVGYAAAGPEGDLPRMLSPLAAPQP
jgi:hypothetical protein